MIEATTMTGDNKDYTGRVIYNFIPVNRNLCITISEVKAILEYFPYGHPHRLCFGVLACTGLRASEVMRIKLDSFLNSDCTEFKVPISKTKPKKYVSGTIVYNIKVRTCKLPKVLGLELRWYIENNYHLFKDRYLFPFSKDSLRRYLCKLRFKAKKGLIRDPILTNALIDTIGERYAIGLKVNSAYRFTLHSFRRFYLTYMRNAENMPLEILSKHIGHKLKETTMTYLYNPEFIGLTNSFKCLKGFKEFFDVDQRTLIDFE